MTFIADLDLCRYHVGPFHSDNWAVPLVAVGWLEHPHTFPRGSLDYALIERLRGMVSEVRGSCPGALFRGVKHCSFCVAEHVSSPGPIWSQENIFVPGESKIYIAPGGIVHYVEKHAYLPPREFVEAILNCPKIGSVEFRATLLRANGGNELPLRNWRT